MNPPGDWYPRLSGTVDPSLEEALRIAFDNLYSLRGSGEDLAASLAALPPSLDLSQITKALQLGGSSPLVLEGLLGVLAQVQRSVNFGTHAQRLAKRPQDLPQQLWAETDRQQALYYSTGSVWRLIVAIGVGSFETRWADLGVNDSGALWIETSRSAISAASSFPVFRWTGTTWVYVVGLLIRTQAQIATLLATLTANDGGLLVYISDYPHWLLWNTVSFQFGPGDPGSDYIVATAGVVPQGNPNSWGICDGSGYLVLKGDGTTLSRTTPNLTGEVFLKGGNYSGSQQSANASTWTSGARTDDEANHTHNVSVLGESILNGNGSFQLVGQDDIYVSSAGTPHNHNLSNNNATLNPPSETDGGLPLRIGLTWYLRR